MTVRFEGGPYDGREWGDEEARRLDLFFAGGRPCRHFAYLASPADCRGVRSGREVNGGPTAWYCYEQIDAEGVVLLRHFPPGDDLTP